MTAKKTSSKDTGENNKTQNTKELEKLQETIEKLQKELNEKEQIAKRAQADYVSLKLDMDSYIQRVEQQKKDMHRESLIHVMKKVLPHITNMHHSVAATPKELAEHSWTEWVHMVAKKLLQEIEQLGIQAIQPELGTDPDLNLHQPIGTHSADKKLQGKIAKLIETGYMVQENGQTSVIFPAKVMIGGE